MKREIITIRATCDCDTIEMTGFADEPTGWLSRQMRIHQLHYLLAHSDDGIIWGRLDGEELLTSHDIAPELFPPLRAETLQTARIFAPAGELLVWRDEMGAWTGRLTAEDVPGAPADWTEAFDELQILWGTEARPRERGFSLVSEGSQRLAHLIPLALPEQIDRRHRPVRLVVRHYLKEEADGFTRIDASRLLDLRLLPEPKEGNP